jgi:BASS family bile acid:Na+ symporter
MLLVAVLLLNAALGVDLAELGGVVRQTGALVVSLLAVWIGPAVVVVLASLMFAMRGGPEGNGLLLGMILVAAMPVANSSAGWTQQSGGSLGWALSLVVFSIVLSPIVTPGVVRLLGLSLSTAQSASVEEIVTKFSGVTFILWVLVPTIVGLLVRYQAGGPRIDRLKSGLHLSTAAAILGLNYLNGARVLPELFPRPEDSLFPQPNAALLISAVAGALALCLSGLLVARLLERAFGWDRQKRLALDFALSMKHTGLALGLATTVLADQPEAILLIIIATPTQHLLAGIVSRRQGVEG